MYRKFEPRDPLHMQDITGLRFPISHFQIRAVLSTVVLRGLEFRGQVGIFYINNKVVVQALQKSHLITGVAVFPFLGL